MQGVLVLKLIGVGVIHENAMADLVSSLNVFKHTSVFCTQNRSYCCKVSWCTKHMRAVLMGNCLRV
jgi:hypothetical protein